MSEWIKLADRKPEQGQQCFVANENEIVGFAQWGSADIKESPPINAWVFKSAPMYCCFIQGDYWMPLPNPLLDN